LNNFYNYKIIIEKFGKQQPFNLNLFYQALSKLLFIHCGVMKPLADIPSCLGGGEHRINEK
jgi:hypothetical protein